VWQVPERDVLCDVEGQRVIRKLECVCENGVPTFAVICGSSKSKRMTAICAAVGAVGSPMTVGSVRD
jgi:hypothetical protein